MQGCGGGSNCDLSSFPLDPTGRWAGVMVRVESDCGDDSRGEEFSFEHSVSQECIGDDSVIKLENEDLRDFVETDSSSFFGDGSFSVGHESTNIVIDISYDNYDGSIADVTQKIRLYDGGRIRCSERYRGQARKN